MKLQNCKLVTDQASNFSIQYKEDIVFKQKLLKPESPFTIPLVQLEENYTIIIDQDPQISVNFQQIKHQQTYYIQLSDGIILDHKPLMNYLQFQAIDQKLEDDKKLKDQHKKEQEKWVFKSEGEIIDPQNSIAKPKKQEALIVNSSISNVVNVTNLNTSNQYEKILTKLKLKGAGHSQFQSSSSLQHSIPEVSFSKANRFQYNFDGQTDFNYSLPSTFDKSPSKGTSFGFGQKFIVPDHILRNAKSNPAPDQYFRTESIPIIQPQRTQNWSQSVRFQPKSELSGQQQPAPNNYNLQHKFGQSKSKFSFGLKSKELTQFQDCVPSPNEYNQSIKFVSSNRFSSIGLGFGQKTQLGSKNDTPGPGQYDLPSLFKKNANSIIQPMLNVL